MLDFSVTFIITVINIVILFFILRAILFKPVTKFMADRARRVQDSIDQAEREKAAAQRLHAEYENKLKNIETEAGEIFREARKNAGQEAEKIVARGKAEAAEIIANAHKQLEMEHTAALAKFRAEAAALVVTAAARLVQRELASEDNRHYANLLLEELVAQKRKT